MVTIGGAECEGCKYDASFKDECEHCIRHHEAGDYYDKKITTTFICAWYGTCKICEKWDKKEWKCVINGKHETYTPDPKPIECPSCHGAGGRMSYGTPTENFTEWDTCWTCKGNKVIDAPKPEVEVDEE